MASENIDDNAKDTNNDLFGDSSSEEEEEDEDDNKNKGNSNNKDDDEDDDDTDDLIAAAKSQPIAHKKKEDGGAATAATSKNKKTSSSNNNNKSNLPDADNDDDNDDEAGLFDSSSEEDESYAAAHTKLSSKKSKAASSTVSSSGKKTLGKKRKAETTTSKTSTSKSSNKKKIKSTSDGSTGTTTTKDTRSMKERMEALARKRAAAASGGGGEGGGGGGEDTKGSAQQQQQQQQPRRKKKRSKDGKEDGSDGKEETGYDSGDSYDSTTFERTKDDDDFIDADDEDPDSLRELYAEQHFEDERPDGEDSDEDQRGMKNKKTKKSSSSSGGGLDKISLSDDDEENGTETASSALKAAVRRMQKVKKEVMKLPELEEMGIAFLKKMEEAASADEACIKAKRPGLKKLAMLQEVTDMLSKKDMVRVLLDLDLLTVCKRWIQPLSNGALGNVTLRRRIVECTVSMTGEDGINATDLKRSGYGKVIMALYTHKSETPEMKKMLRAAIEQWSRPIFQKSGNLRDLERVQNSASSAMSYEAGSSLAGMMKSRVGSSGIGSTPANSHRPSSSSGSFGGNGGGAAAAAGGGAVVRGKTEDDLERIISSGASSARDLGNNRVRVPYSKGFQYTVRPESRRGDVSDKRNLISAKGSSSATGGGMGSAVEAERREALSKRMEAKSKKTNKMANRSANISIEGRAVK